MDPKCLDLPRRPPPPLVTAFDAASKISAMRAVAPISAVWKIKKALNVGSEKKLREAVNLVRGSVTQIIRSKKEKIETNGCEKNFHGAGGDL
ncbi:jasmonoyl-L-amino acid 12-hydroxylase, partial [Sarracenia purpurea var. burkii]